MDKSSYQHRIKQHIQTAYMLSAEKSEQLIPNFLLTLRKYALELEPIHARGDLQALGKTSHTVKGALLNLGLTELADVAYAIERNSKSENREYNYRETIQELTKTILLFT